MEKPTSKFHRLSQGKEVRLKNAYIIKCQAVIKDEHTGQIVELHCSYDPDSRRGGTTAGRRVKGTLHWVSAPHAIKAEVRLFDYLFTVENPEDDETGDITSKLNPNSMIRLT